MPIDQFPEEKPNEGQTRATNSKSKYWARELALIVVSLTLFFLVLLVLFSASFSAGGGGPGQIVTCHDGNVGR